ncbi:MAG: glycosyltransferase family 4 protein [Flavobacteriales bacterium]|jgi:glycosyltransferase involved in cell wall biosynthesis|nr:glycosyltransferase family 4 protein [Flavobacteriales bacterium]
MKKVLLITYYWPPSGGSGVQRWLNFTKYLKDFDIDPVVYTVSNPNYAIQDTSLREPDGITVIRQPIWEPYNMASFLSGKSAKQTSSGFLEQSNSIKSKLVNYIRANYFIPDARKFWIKPSVKYLKKYLQENNIDTIITSGPPHSLHLIGLALKTQLNLKWIADFRDPWTQIDYFHKLPFSKWALQKQHRLEQKVVQNADSILVVSSTMKDFYGTFNKNVSVITNGFDSVTEKHDVILDAAFTITHIGLLNADRNHAIFWQVLRELIDENTAFKESVRVKLIGKVSVEVTQSVATYNLESYVDFIDYVSHDKVAKLQQSAQVLFLPVNNVPSAKGIITGKIFEYLLAKRPILAIAPVNGDLAKIITKTNAGKLVGFEDKKKLKSVLVTYFEAYQKGALVSDVKGLEDYHAKNITKKIAELIQKVSLK